MKILWTITATSFTGVMLMNALFIKWGFSSPGLSADIVLQVFVLCLTITLAQLFFNRVEPRYHMKNIWSNVLMDALSRCLICVIMVFGEGVLFKFFPPSWTSLSLLLPILIPVFIITYTVTYYSFRQTSKEAEFINKKIKERK